jgi:hypothetical protein
MIKFFLAILPLFIFVNINAQTNLNENEAINIGSSIQIESKFLIETCRLNIYLPEGYHNGDTSKYPVVYLLDGAVNEDFVHIIGLYQYFSMDWIDFVPKSIVIGIVTNDRKRDYTFKTNIKTDSSRFPTSGNSENFISYIQKEVKPFINQNFRTNTNATLIGQSLGGLLATEILFKSPTLFDNYLIISPSIWWNNGSILESNSNPFDKIKSPINIYLAVGKEGLTPSAIPRVMEVDVNLLKEKIDNINNENINLVFDYLPDENHATILHQAVINAIKSIGNK